MGGRGCNCPPPPKFLADYLTLSQPGAAPPHYYVPNPQIFRPLYSPVVNFVCNPLSLSQVYDNFHSSESRLGSFWATYVLLRLGLILAPDISARHFGKTFWHGYVITRTFRQVHVLALRTYWHMGVLSPWTFRHGLFGTGTFWQKEFLAQWTFRHGIFWHLNISAHGYFGTLQSNMDILAQICWLYNFTT